MNRTSIARVVAAVTLISSIASGQSAKISYGKLLRAPTESFYHVSVGIGEDYPEESTTPKTVKGDMEFLRRTDMHLLRITFGWDGIETEKGKFTWDFWDDYIKRAVDEYGITLVPYICYTPRWNSTGDSTNYWNHTPVDYEEFGHFVEALVNRYKDRIKTWELWNEPDIKEFWSGSAEDLARLTKIGAQAVRRADPSARVVLAGLAGHTDFTLSLFRDYGISPYVDIVNCHSYFETWSPSPLEEVVPYVRKIAGIIHRYGNGQTLWMAEVGYSTFRKDDGYVSSQYHCTYDYEHTPPYQAVALWKTLTLLLSTEKIAAVTWYRIRDLPEGEVVIGDVNNRHLGLDQLDFTPKPAEKAVTFFNRFFAQKYHCVDSLAVIRRQLVSESEVHAFSLEDGSLAVIAWLRTGSLAAGAGMIKDVRTERISLDLPAGALSHAERFDELGNSFPFTDFRVHGAVVHLEDLVLQGGRIVVLKLQR